MRLKKFTFGVVMALVMALTIGLVESPKTHIGKMHIQTMAKAHADPFSCTQLIDDLDMAGGYLLEWNPEDLGGGYYAIFFMASIYGQTIWGWCT